MKIKKGRYKKFLIIIVFILFCSPIQKIGIVIHSKCEQNIYGDYHCVSMIRTIENSPTVIAIEEYVGNRADTVIVEKKIFKWKLINSYEYK